MDGLNEQLYYFLLLIWCVRSIEYGGRIAVLGRVFDTPRELVISRRDGVHECAPKYMYILRRL